MRNMAMLKVSNFKLEAVWKLPLLTALELSYMLGNNVQLPADIQLRTPTIIPSHHSMRLRTQPTPLMQPFTGLPLPLASSTHTVIDLTVCISLCL
eukprot:m.123614 g.123614  ORF g.123614 m.123614 type:complete len:95 (-) comp15683_c0_seq2:1002-1286(-)